MIREELVLRKRKAKLEGGTNMKLSGIGREGSHGSLVDFVGAISRD